MSFWLQSEPYDVKIVPYWIQIVIVSENFLRLKADAFIEGKNWQFSSQTYFLLKVKTITKISGKGIAESVRFWICIKQAGFKAWKIYFKGKTVSKIQFRTT